MSSGSLEMLPLELLPLELLPLELLPLALLPLAPVGPSGGLARRVGEVAARAFAVAGRSSADLGRVVVVVAAVARWQSAGEGTAHDWAG